MHKKNETFLGAIVLMGIWLLTNWFKVVIIILLIIICNDLADLNANTSYMQDMEHKLNGIWSIDSDIRYNTSNIDTNTKSQNQYNTYPSIIR